MSRERTLIVAGPEPAVPGSSPVPCRLCQQRVYPTLSEVARRTPSIVVICLPCARRLYRYMPGPIMVSPETLATLSQTLGRQITMGEAAARASEIMRG